MFRIARLTGRAAALPTERGATTRAAPPRPSRLAPELRLQARALASSARGLGSRQRVGSRGPSQSAARSARHQREVPTPKNGSQGVRGRVLSIGQHGWYIAFDNAGGRLSPVAEAFLSGKPAPGKRASGRSKQAGPEVPGGQAVEPVRASTALRMHLESEPQSEVSWRDGEPAARTKQDIVSDIIAASVEQAPPGASALLRFANAPESSLSPGDSVVVFPLGSLEDLPTAQGGPSRRRPAGSGLGSLAGKPSSSKQAAGKLLEVAPTPHNAKSSADCARQLISEVVRSGGRLALNDKSPPDVIHARLAMSKSQFRRALGYHLSRRRLLVAGGELVLVNRTKRAQLLAEAQQKHAADGPDKQAPAAVRPTSFPLWPHRKRVSPALAPLALPGSGVSRTQAAKLLDERRRNQAEASLQAQQILLEGSPARSVPASKGLALRAERAEGAAWVAAQRLASSAAKVAREKELVGLDSGVDASFEDGLVLTIDSDGERFGRMTADNVFEEDRPERKIRLRSDAPAGASGRRRRGSPAVAVFADDRDDSSDSDSSSPAAGEASVEATADSWAHRAEELEAMSLLSDSDEGSSSDWLDEDDLDGLPSSDEDEDDGQVTLGDEELAPEAQAGAAEVGHGQASGQVPLGQMPDSDFSRLLDPLGVVAAGKSQAPARRAGLPASRKVQRELRKAAAAVPPPQARHSGRWRKLRVTLPQPDLGGGVIPEDESDDADLEYFKRLEGGVFPGRSDAAVEEAEEVEEDERWTAMVGNWLRLTDQDGVAASGPVPASLSLAQLKRHARRQIQATELRRGTTVSRPGLTRKRKEARRRVDGLIAAASKADDGGPPSGDSRA